jgi:F-type H+-transporting ATPase subunit alpha
MALSPAARIAAEAEQLLGRFDAAVERHAAELAIVETGAVLAVQPGIARISGLPGVEADELVSFRRRGVHDGSEPPLGIAFNLDAQEVGVILLGDSQALQAGDEVRRTGRVVDVPVGPALIGRVLNGLGEPLDSGGPVECHERWPAEREAPGILERDPVTVPLQTGIKVVDALFPVGRGQRELIIGDRQTGKTTIAVDTILNQRDTGVVCIYCAIGKRSAAIAHVIAALSANDAMAYSVVVAASAQDPPGLRYLTPYAATTMGEYFSEQGRDVLIVYDDLTHHARTYRELSLLLRRPPGREAYPGDIFYLHSRLLERATHLGRERGGGSLTALPIVETQAQNISAYIPTNLISITDGQIALSPDLFRRTILPAVDVSHSVSRVGGKAQLPAYRAVAGDLRLSYAQFLEAEVFTRFGTQVDEGTRQVLTRGRRCREVLRQDKASPLTVAQQVAILLAVSGGLLDTLPLEEIDRFQEKLCRHLTEQHSELCARIDGGAELHEQDRAELEALIRTLLTE